jgi:hypothetical protein
VFTRYFESEKFQQAATNGNTTNQKTTVVNGRPVSNPNSLPVHHNKQQITHRKDHEIDASFDDNDDEDDDEEGLFSPPVGGGLNLRKVRHESYLSPMTMILANIEKFPEHKFQENQKWIVPWLSQLILCDNDKIRFILGKIYQKHVNPKFC